MRKIVSGLVFINGFVVIIAAFAVLFGANMEAKPPPPTIIDSIDSTWSAPYNPQYITIVLAEAMVRAELPKNKKPAFDFGLRHGVLTKSERSEIDRKINQLNNM